MIYFKSDSLYISLYNLIFGRISKKDKVRNIVINSTSPEIEIAGIPTKNESLAAVFLSMPENSADVKVNKILKKRLIF